MFRLLPALILTLCAHQAHGQCKQLVDGYCADSFVTLRLTRGQPIKLNVLIAQQNALKVQLPKGTIVDEGTLNIGSKALQYVPDDAQAVSSFVLSPRPTTHGSTVGWRTNILFEVEGQTVILDVKIAVGQGVQQIRLEFPELEAERQHEEDLRKRIRAELEAQLKADRANIGKISKDIAKEMLLNAALARLTCSIEKERGFDQYLTLKTKRICAIGEWIFIEVEVENGRRKDFELREIAVDGVWDDSPRPLPFKTLWVTQSNPPKRVSMPLKLRFEDAVRGMFLISPPTDSELPDSYQITLKERGGLKRIVTASDIEF
jgi:hypothetical protein